MTDFVYVIDAKGVPTGESVPVQIGNRWFAVCQDKGEFYVTDILCPHAGGPLGCAEVHDGKLVCPVHYWPWNLETGLSDRRGPHLRLHRYQCVVQDGKVYADVSVPIPLDPSMDLSDSDAS